MLVFHDWDAVADNLPSACTATPAATASPPPLSKNNQTGPVRPILFTSRVTLNAERSRAPLDLEAGSIVWVIERLRGHL